MVEGTEGLNAVELLQKRKELLESFKEALSFHACAIVAGPQEEVTVLILGLMGFLQ